MCIRVSRVIWMVHCCFISVRFKVQQALLSYLCCQVTNHPVSLRRSASECQLWFSRLIWCVWCGSGHPVVTQHMHFRGAVFKYLLERQVCILLLLLYQRRLGHSGDLVSCGDLYSTVRTFDPASCRCSAQEKWSHGLVHDTKCQGLWLAGRVD